MAGKNEGLPNNGLTQFFNFLYDSNLSSARGKDLAADMMMHCDNDFTLLQRWFSGRWSRHVPANQRQSEHRSDGRRRQPNQPNARYGR